MVIVILLEHSHSRLFFPRGYKLAVIIVILLTDRVQKGLFLILSIIKVFLLAVATHARIVCTTYLYYISIS